MKNHLGPWTRAAQFSPAEVAEIAANAFPKVHAAAPFDPADPETLARRVNRLLDQDDPGDWNRLARLAAFRRVVGCKVNRVSLRNGTFTIRQIDRLVRHGLHESPDYVCR